MPENEVSSGLEEGICVPACERGYWLRMAPRLTSVEVAALSKRERVGWICRSQQQSGDPAGGEGEATEAAEVCPNIFCYVFGENI